MVRDDQNDQIYKTKDGKWRRSCARSTSATRRASRCSSARSPSRSPSCSPAELKKRGIPHDGAQRQARVRRARGRDHRRGRPPGAVTIATNMAGRGVDIKLGGNAEHLARLELRASASPSRTTASDDERFGQGLSADRGAGRGRPREGLEAGGLYICGTERHESRRIDNQLRGRSGRQGDPGESRFFLSAEDDLVRLFAGDRIYGSSTASATPTTRATRSRSRPGCSPSRSKAPRRRSRSRTSSSASASSSTTT